ncbi:DUF6584 family protein [Luteimicrobium subarcticum]|uniref:DUF6584 family protein n=1 Tax=Luteimicrobium subarcticum TaxID=620910 RepID=UPI0012FE0C8E|nr:DUF6584 family protein [Luteimicrobium subarcticum]
MPWPETLRTAEAELAARRTALARRRLRGLVRSCPDRLDLRLALAEAYRRGGDAAQAGRWSYLAEQRDPREVAAFERCYPDPFLRMRSMQWRGPVDVAGPVAAARLTALVDAATASEHRSVTLEGPMAHDPPWPATSLRDTAGCVGVGLIFVALAGLVGAAVVGVAWLVVHGARLLIGS